VAIPAFELADLVHRDPSVAPRGAGSKLRARQLHFGKHVKVLQQSFLIAASSRLAIKLMGLDASSREAVARAISSLPPPIPQILKSV